MFTRPLAAALALGLTIASPAAAQMMAPEGTEVYFVNLSDGETVSSPVKVVFGLSGMGVAPAGTEKENTGHHHILIDRPPLGEGEEGELTYGPVLSGWIRWRAPK